jgi:hypothetical protein
MEVLRKITNPSEKAGLSVVSCNPGAPKRGRNANKSLAKINTDVISRICDTFFNFFLHNAWQK